MELEEFPKKGKKCKKCTAEYKKEYSKKNKEKIIESRKNFREKNKEKIKIKQKKYYEENSEVLKAKVKAYSELNKDKIREYKKEYNDKNYDEEYHREYRKNNKEEISSKRKEYYKSNKEKIIKYQQENKKHLDEKKREHYLENKSKYNERARAYVTSRKLTDSLYRLKCSIRSLISQSFRMQYTKKSKKTIEILGCNFEEFKAYIEDRFTPEMNWNNYATYWQLDHIIPISWANSEEEVYMLNHYTNFQPKFWLENIKKGNRHDG